MSTTPPLLAWKAMLRPSGLQAGDSSSSTPGRLTTRCRLPRTALKISRTRSFSLRARNATRSPSGDQVRSLRPLKAPYTRYSYLLVKPLVRFRKTLPSLAETMATSRSSQRLVITAISSPEGDSAGENQTVPSRSLCRSSLPNISLP